MNKSIILTLPPDGLWLGLVERSILSFAETVGFSETLRRMLTSATLEACEELINASDAAGSQEPYRLVLEFRDKALIVEIEYDDLVQLNPHKADDYEVPNSAEDLNELEAASLWLHLIKRRMDRVFFRVHGSQRALRMIKYIRESGWEGLDWIMVMRPKLKKGLHLHLSDHEKAYPSGVLQSPDGAVLKLGPSETFVIRRMDGATTLYDIYMAHVEELGMVSPSDLVALYERMEACEMLADTDQDRRQSRWRRVLHRVVNPDISIPRADACVARVYAWSRFLFTPFGLGALLALGLSGVIPAWMHFERFKEVVFGLEMTFLDSPIILLPLYVLILLSIIFHELGHGVVCKHYGGKVPRLGIMFYLSTFIFYCDTTAALNFPRKRQRLLVSLGGPIVSFAVLGVGLWAAGTMSGSASLWETVLVAFSLINFFALVMGFNPLIKMDGYYILSDLTEIPNLRSRSFLFLERRLLGWLGFGEDKDLLATHRERRIFWWYGIFGALFTVVFQVLPVVEFVRLMNAESVSGGRLVWAVIICVLLSVRVASVTLKKLNAMRDHEYNLT